MSGMSELDALAQTYGIDTSHPEALLHALVALRDYGIPPGEIGDWHRDGARAFDGIAESTNDKTPPAPLGHEYCECECDDAVPASWVELGHEDGECECDDAPVGEVLPSVDLTAFIDKINESVRRIAAVIVTPFDLPLRHVDKTSVVDAPPRVPNVAVITRLPDGWVIASHRPAKHRA